MTMIRKGLVLLAVFAAASIGQSDDQAFHWVETPGKSLALSGSNGLVWQFNYAPEQPKPYFDPVSLVTGESLTWNEPPDHAWHHALWFSWHTINGVNYWEPLPDTKRAAGRTSWKPPNISTNDQGGARIELQVTYAPANSTPVLRENRLIEITAPDEQGRYHFDWIGEFQAVDQDVTLACVPIPPAIDGKPWGGYAGLSLRLHEQLIDREVVTDHAVAAFDASGVYRSAARACAYQGSLQGKPASVAIIDATRNPRHPTPWYAIKSSMSYVNPSFLMNQPYSIQAGQSLRLQYRLIIQSKHWSPVQLAAAADELD